MPDALGGVLEAAPARLEDSLLDVGEARKVSGEGLEDVPVELLQVPVQLPGRPAQPRVQIHVLAGPVVAVLALHIA